MLYNRSTKYKFEKCCYPQKRDMLLHFAPLKIWQIQSWCYLNEETTGIKTRLCNPSTGLSQFYSGRYLINYTHCHIFRLLRRNEDNRAKDLMQCLKWSYREINLVDRLAGDVTRWMDEQTDARRFNSQENKWQCR